mgnify:FL=1
MLRKKKILTAALCAGGVVLSAALTAAETETTIVSQQFARVTGDLTQLGGDKPGTWEGYGSVTNQTAGYAKPVGVGSPINDATDKLYLSVDGSVICTAATEENKPATVDMMIQISRPDEALALPTGETTTDDIQIALGVETDGTLKAYCKNRNGVTGWYALGETQYAEGAWHRVSFTFDYGHRTCQIRLDGEPLMTADGYLTSDPEGASAAIGSWYKLNTATVQKLSSLKVVGSTAIDEVVVKYGEGLGDVQPPLADIGGSTASGVPYQWIAKQGITRAQAEAATLPDNSGMSALEKYQTGLPVGDGKTYVITAMAMAGEAGNVEVTLTVPKMTPSEGRQNVVVWGTSPDKMEKKVVLETNAAAVELRVPADGASGVTKVYYQLKNELKNEPVAQQ